MLRLAHRWIFIVLVASLVLAEVSGIPLIGARELESGVTLSETRILAEPYVSGQALPGTEDPRFSEPNPRRLLRPSGSGRFSYTFAAPFSLDPASGPVTLYLGPCDYPFELWLNNVDLFSGGKAEGPYSSSLFSSFAIRLPESLLARDKTGTNTLSLRIFPSEGDEDYPPPPFILMTPARAAGAVFLRNFLRVDLVRAASFTALVLALYFFVLAASRRGGRSYLFFALLCLSFAAAYTEISLQTEAISELLLKKLSKIGFVSILFFFPAFFMSFTKRPRRQAPWFLGLAIPALGFALLFLLQPSKVAIDAVFGFVMMLDFGFCMVFAIIILLRAIFKDKTPGAALLLGSVGLVLATSGLDLLSIFSGSLPYAYLTPYGFLAVVITIFIVLAREQGRLAEEALRRARENEEHARFQTELMEKVRAAAATLVSSNRELEEGMAKAGALIAESGTAAHRAADSSRERAHDAQQVASLLAEQIERSAERIPEAVRGQTSFVTTVTSTLTTMNERISGLAGEAARGSAAAEGLAHTGDEAVAAVAESRKAAEAISTTSVAVREILDKIEDLADKTNTLAINTAIEAARAGQAGRGFAVISQSIRALSAETSEHLRTSRDRLVELEDATRRNASASSRVDEGLAAIVAAGRDTAHLIDRISADILERRKESNLVVVEAQRLLEDTRSVEELFGKALAENTEARQGIGELAAAFDDIERLFEDEVMRIEGLNAAVGSALRAAAQDREAMAVLEGILNIKHKLKT